ncbi:MAG: UDP-N-acetylmuramoyl-L-alanyl-D-glutamate--2,6-diaminopimelate ligase [Bacillota bacterium]
MILGQLLQGLDIIDIRGNLDKEISSIEYDSRKVKKGSLFICIKGFQVDGHDFALKAVQNGATALLVEDDIEFEDVTIIRVKNTRLSMPLVAAAFYDYPTESLKLIGITGTKGKSTIAFLVRSILEANKSKVGLIGTICSCIGDRIISSVRTTPESIDLQCIFKEMLDEGIEYAVMEVSSHSLALNRVDGCDFKIGVFTNLSQDHLDFHKDFEDYRNAKKKLFYKTTEANIINADDYHGRIIIDEIKKLNTRLITFAIDSYADITAKDVDFDAKGVRFTLVTPEYEIPIENTIPGKFSVYNCLAAAAACYTIGIDKEVIREGLGRIRNVPGRSEVVDIDKPYTVIIDYAHSPDSLENILKAVRQYTKARIITLFGCGGNRDKEKRPMMGETAGRLSDYCIITSDNPRSEEPMDIIRQIEVGMKKTACDYICIENRKDAIKFALTIAREGDTVLLAGKGHETYQELKDGKIDFDEKEIVRELIAFEV